MQKLYQLFVFDGQDLAALDDPYAPSLSYQHLTFDEAVELLRLSFRQGYGAVVWMEDTKQENGSAADG